MKILILDGETVAGELAALICKPDGEYLRISVVTPVGNESCPARIICYALRRTGEMT